MTTKDDRILDCGHKPSPHSECTTGTAHTQDGREICWDCSNLREREAMANAQRYGAYLNGDGSEVHTWPGGKLGTVTQSWERKNNMAGRLTHLRVTAFDGSRWWGTSPGRGMYCRLHRAA